MARRPITCNLEFRLLNQESHSIPIDACVAKDGGLDLVLLSLRVAWAVLSGQIKARLFRVKRAEYFADAAAGLDQRVQHLVKRAKVELWQAASVISHEFDRSLAPDFIKNIADDLQPGVVTQRLDGRPLIFGDEVHRINPATRGRRRFRRMPHL